MESNRVYGLVWDAVVPTNESFPVADYDFMPVQTLYCMYRPYWICGCKGYLIHKAHIPPVVELKIAYMAKFGMLSFPQTRVSLWQIMILLQFGSWTVCTSHIGSVKGRFGIHSSYTPCCGMKNRVYMAKFGVPSIPQSRPSLWQIMFFMSFWTPNCMYQTNWVRGSKGYVVHKAHIPPAVELKVAYMAKFGVPSFPQTRASLWQIRILWQFGPQTVCTSHIGSVGLSENT